MAIECNQINQTAAELKMKFEACNTLNAEDMQTFIDLTLAISVCGADGPSIPITHYKLPLDDTNDLTNLNYAILVDKERHYIKSENADYFWDSSATSGDLEPFDKGLNTLGYWKRITISFDNLSDTPDSKIASRFVKTSSDGNNIEYVDVTTITAQQAIDIIDNNLKVGITTEQADAIVANTAKTGITAQQSDDIVANTAKVGINVVQSDAIVANTAKVGITPTQSSAITSNTSNVASNSILISGLSNGSGAQTYDTLAAASAYYDNIATDPKPVNGVRFYVNQTLDAINGAFVWSFQSGSINNVRQEEAIVSQSAITAAIDLKTDKTTSGDNADLTTSDKTNIVAGVNEIDGNIKSITTPVPTSINLFDSNAPLKLEAGYYNNTNTLISSASWVTIALIPVLPMQEYTISPFGNANVASFANGFDASGTPINSITLVKTVGTKGSFTTGIDDVFVALGMLRTEYEANKDTLQIELGDTPTTYVPYTSSLLINNENVEGYTDLANQVTTLNTLTTTDPSGKNLFNKDGENWLENGFYSNGNFISNAAFVGLPLVEVPEFADVTITPFQATNTFSFIYCVDADGNYLGDATLVNKVVGAGGTGYGTFRTIRNTKYISLATLRTTFAMLGDIIQVELGSVQTSFEAYLPQLLIDPLDIKDYSELNSKLNSVTDLRSTFPNPSYEGISDKFSNFREAVLAKKEDAIVCITGTSLSQGTPWASTLPDATTRPPLLFTSNFASGVYDELVKLYPTQESRRYDHAFFTEAGTGWLTEKDNALWDNRINVEGYTRFTTAANAGVSFVVPADSYRFNYIYRTDSAGDTCSISITEGNSKMEAFDGTNWVEANGFTFSMLEPVATSTKGNTVYQKRLNMRSKNRYSVGGINSIGETKNVSINKGANTNMRFLSVGAEWSRAEFMLQVINGARGSHNWGTGTLDLARFQDSDLHIHNPTLILAEITTINWGGSNKASLQTSPQFYVDNTRRWYFNGFNDEPDSLFAKTNGYTTTDVLFYNDTMTGSIAGSGAWDVDGDSANLAWGTVTQAGDYLGSLRTCLTSYEVVDEYVRANQPTYAYISLNRDFQNVAEGFFAGYFEGLIGSGADGNTLLNDGVHWNDNGVALVMSILLPAFKF